MSMRPQMAFICGINNADKYPKPNLYKTIPTVKILREESNCWETEWNMAAAYIKDIASRRSRYYPYSQYKKRLDDVFYARNEYSPNNILGLVIEPIANQDRYSEMVYYLSVFHPEYQVAGYKIMPSIPLDDDVSDSGRALKFYIHQMKTGIHDPAIAKRYLLRATFKKYIIDHGWNLHYGDWSLSFSYALATKILMKHAGLDVPMDDLKFMLVWSWS